MHRAGVGALLGALALVAGVATAAQRWFTPEIAASGEPVYRAHCARCHGPAGEGAGDWRRRDASGRFPPPPLDGSGHTWHHPIRILLHVIENGSPGGQGNMPAWKDVLSREEILSVIAWFQSRWPDEVYAAWLDIEKRSRQQ